MSKSSCFVFLLLGILVPKAFAAPVFSSGASFVTNAPIVTGQSNAISVIAVATTGDGLLDLISVTTEGTNQPGTLTVFTNNNVGGFGSNATYAVGIGLSSVAAANTTGDGYMDLICSLTNGTLVVLTNNGSGVYGSNATYVVGHDPINVTTADVNGDGYPDLISANYNGGNIGTLTVLTNNGSGIFGSNTTLNVGNGAHYVAAADINGDGHVDLISANFNGNSLTVLTNNGSGGFAVSDTLNVSQPFPASVAVADVNGDGLPDLICPDDNSTGTLTIFTNAGNGRFTVSSMPGQGVSGAYGLNNPYFVAAVTNLDGHGLMALVAANAGTISGNTLTILTNNGTGVFGSNTTVHVGSAPVCVAAADFFGNGMMDLVSANGGTNTLSVLSNNTAFYNPTFTVGSPVNFGVSASGSPTAAFILTNALPRGMFFTDNSNGTAFFGGTPLIGSGGVYTFSLLASNNVSPFFTAQKITMTVNQRPIFTGDVFATNAALRVNNSGTYSVAVADVNGDGYPDLISTYENSSLNIGQLSIFTNNGAGGFGSNATYNVGSFSFPYDVQVVTNLNGHGLMGLVTANYGSGSGNTLTVLTNNGTGIFGSNATYIVGRGPYSVTAADIFGNGRPALISANYNSGTLTVLTNNGWGIMSSNTAYNLGADGTECVIAADLNRKGRMDLVSANTTSSSLTVLTNNGNGGFAISTTLFINDPASVTAADIYGNGKLALICNNSSSSTLTVFTNRGNGLFGLNATLNVPGSPQCVMAADINGDGYVDLISLNSLGALTFLTNNGAGVFGTNMTLNALGGSGTVNGLAVADVNNDGRVDLALANSGSGTLTVLTNGIGTNYTLFLQGSAGSTATLVSGYPAPVVSSLSGTPPTGITFNNGAFSGTPASFGQTVFSNVVVTVTNALGASSGSLWLDAYQGPLATSPTNYNVTRNGTLTTGVSGLVTNDTEPNFEILAGHDFYFPLYIAAVSPTSTNGGTVTLSLPFYQFATFTYHPANNFTGQDGFTYTLQDGIGLTAQGSVLVTVYPSPVAGTNILSTVENTALTFSVTNLLANDADPGSFALNISAVSATSTNGGTVGLSGGLITYTPAANATGLDAFTYTLKDSLNGSTQGTVSVVVTAPGSPAYNVVQITSPSPGGTAGLYFTGLPNQTYYQQAATNLAGPYIDVPPPLVADTNGLVTNTITILPSSPQMFYRISAQP